MGSHFCLLALAAAAAWGSEFSTFIGDSSDYHVARIQADAAGNTYIAGNRTAGDAYATVFVMKLDAAGNIVVFNTFSGKGADTVNDLAVDAAGNFYVAGSTNSLYLPLRNAFQSTPGPGFVVKFSPDAEQVLFSTYFPAAIGALAVDAAGNVYVTGLTNLPSFPVTPGMPAGTVSSIGSIGSASGAFITKLSSTGDHILYSGLVAGYTKACGAGSSCFLSARTTMGVSIAVDPAGNAYVAGNTDTSDLPTTAGVLLAQGVGAFVAKVNAAGTGLGYLTYIGATSYPFSPYTNPANVAKSIAVDAAGNAYVAGATSDPHFPATPGAYQTVYAGSPTQGSLAPPADGFVLKLNPSGSGAVWASYIGGKGADGANALALDRAGNVWIAGTTASADFPNAQGWSQGGDFVAELNAAGSALPYAGRYPDGAVSQSVAVDSAGMVHVAGPGGLVSALVSSGPPLMRIFGVANAAYGAVSGRIVPGEVISIYGPHIGPAKPVTLTPDSTGAMPTVLAGLQVKVGAVASSSSPVTLSLLVGLPLPLLYASDSQINAVVPYSVSGGMTLRIVQGANSPDFPITAIPAAPEIFQNADGSAAAVNQDGSLNSPGHPAPVGSIVSVWVTGAGLSMGGGAPGTVASAPLNTNCCTVTLAEVPAYVTYAGAAPGAVGGVVQINFEVPALPPYELFDNLTGFTVEAGGGISQTAAIYVLLPPALPGVL